MWLPKDERRLLAGYHCAIGDVDTSKPYRLGDLRRLLAWGGHRVHLPEYGAPGTPSEESDDPSAMKEAIHKYIEETNRLRKANKLLAARDLISECSHEHETNVVIVSLTVSGYDLGRRYAGFFERSGLWFQEYRVHWMWLVLAFFGGAIGVKLIDFVARLLGGR
jgi:hypothetical protein